jgi:hypothetical protein
MRVGGDGGDEGWRQGGAGMKRLWPVLLALSALGSCSATLKIGGTSPSQLNDGTCTAPILTTASSLQVLHVSVAGTAINDSVSVLPNVPFSFSWQVPAGSYPVRCWVSISGRPDLVGCDTTATIQAPAKPGRVHDLRAQ